MVVSDSLYQIYLTVADTNVCTPFLFGAKVVSCANIKTEREFL